MSMFAVHTGNVLNDHGVRKVSIDSKVSRIRELRQIPRAILVAMPFPDLFGVLVLVVLQSHVSAERNFVPFWINPRGHDVFELLNSPCCHRLKLRIARSKHDLASGLHAAVLVLDCGRRLVYIPSGLPGF
jgi:hypothetical protein